MQKLIYFVLFAGLTACGGGDPEAPQIGVIPQIDTTECSNDYQKQFVLDNLYYWYLWNDLLPADINIADYASPEELVFEVTRNFGPQNASNQPLDLFSSVGSLDADQQFFGEGKYEGFGFSWRLENDEMRFTRVFADSPANTVGGFARTQTVVSLDGRPIAEIVANEGVNTALDNATVTFEIRELDGTLRPPVAVTKAVVTIDPIPQWRVIDAGGGRNIGYMELATFISTADPQFNEVFGAFRDANVSEVIVDLRYNGGGLVSTAELLGDYLGGFVAQNLTFSSTEFNADRAAQYNSFEVFSLLANSINLSQLVIIASRGTASASELVTNGMIPHVDVAIVGDNTFGKPVGQIGLEFCEKILRPTSFKLANADGYGDYFDGLPVDCPAADDLDVIVGADLDPNMVAARSYLDTGACPVAALPAGNYKVSREMPAAVQVPREGLPHRELLDAY